MDKFAEGRPSTNVRRTRFTRSVAIVAVLAIIAVGAALWGLQSQFEGATVVSARLGPIPIRVFRPIVDPNIPDGPRPVVVIAHGFAGSQQLMQPIALTLARNGYIAVTFDFAGHGRNSQPLPGGIADLNRSTEALLAEIRDVVAFARALPGTDQRVALVGHSMASDLVVADAMQDRSIAATAAISVFGRDVTPHDPKNLIVIDGAWEPSMLTDAAVRIVGMAAAGPVRPGVTYGDFAAGTARRFVLARGAEHIGVIFSADALRETVAWMNAVFGAQAPSGTPVVIDRRGKWLALLFAGLVALALPASRFLPVISARRLGAGLGWRRLPLVAIPPAVLTPLLLWKAPTAFLPILLGDYLVVHLAIYGVLTAAGLVLLRLPSAASTPRFRYGGPLALATLAVAAYYVLALGLPLDSYVTSFMPSGLRWALIPAMLCGAAPYFLADEWAIRGANPAIGAYALTKFCFLCSLGIAVALNPAKLFFLIIIAPVMLVLFVVYGFVSRWVYERTGDPRVGALGAAMGLAWAISVTFPIVG